MVPIPVFLDERDMLRRRLTETEERARQAAARSAEEAAALRAALAKAEEALETAKLERARAAVETMRHWRTHRREVELLREQQGELLDLVVELEATRRERDEALAAMGALEARLEEFVPLQRGGAAT